jgi:hypothetical protein
MGSQWATKNIFRQQYVYTTSGSARSGMTRLLIDRDQEVPNEVEEQLNLKAREKSRRPIDGRDGR